MSKENVVDFLSQAAEDDRLKDQLQDVTNPKELADLGKKEGFEFSQEHVDEVIKELKQTPGFFATLADAVVRIFSPSQDNYPATGMQPFTGDPNREP